MDRMRLLLAALTLFLLAACQSAAPTAPEAPHQPSASTAAGGDSTITPETARGGGMIGSGT
jgi:outer membrane biogenesis lipoprotein LolB